MRTGNDARHALGSCVDKRITDQSLGRYVRNRSPLLPRSKHVGSCISIESVKSNNKQRSDRVLQGGTDTAKHLHEVRTSARNSA